MNHTFVRYKSDAARVASNDDLRRINIKREDELFYKHKIFIVAWQRADDPLEVAKHFRMTQQGALNKASWLRAQGVPLKTYKLRFTRAKIKELSSLAKKHGGQTKRFNHEEFVKLWQAGGPQLTMKSLGMTNSAAKTLAYNLRQAGVPLRSWHQKIHPAKLKKIISPTTKPPQQKPQSQ